ncbi:MAG TPA: Hsp33 family molecular chaperone HslO [Polyangia bacterium]|nr:Hsp33 family molecular chaperone HslO [Polyangia bacterium]
MTSSREIKPAPADQIARAVWDGGVARVVVAITTATAREAVRRHEATRGAALALARGTTAGLLLATLTKDDERVTLQVIGDGPLSGVTVDARSSGGVRAYVKNPAAGLLVRPALASGAASEGDRQRPSLAPALGQNGVVSVIRDVGLRDNFSGQTPLVTGELDTDVEHYLNISEQIDSALACDALFTDGSSTTIAVSAGILVQALPGTAGSAVIERARFLFRAGALPAALAAGAPLSAEALGAAVLAELSGAGAGALQVLDVRPVHFECPCSRKRAAGSLALLGGAELASMIVEDGKAEVICNFCRERYDFSEAELETIRRETVPSGALPS